MKKGKKYLCNVCKKNTLVSEGWHLEHDLDFCSNQCVADFIEKMFDYMVGFINKLNKQEKRIIKIEKKLKVKK